jgi:threonyl-tRNA synthetase
MTKVKIHLSTRPARPEDRAGDDATWDKAESALRSVLDKTKREYFIKEGDGAFYGPKIDIEVADALGRFYQLGTIQLDFQLPQRFNLHFINSSGEKETPVVIHRALLGSLERFFAIYLEHVGGAFPFWLAPIQAVVIPIKTDVHLNYCQELTQTLKELGLRVEIDDRSESMGKKTRESQIQKIPFMLVVGDKEIADKTISLRAYGTPNSVTISVDEVMEKFRQLNSEALPIKWGSKWI